MKQIPFILAILILSSCANAERKNNSLVSIESQTNLIPLEVKQDSNVSMKAYKLGDIHVKLTQTKSDRVNFYCKAILVTTKDNAVIDSISFNIEPVGGHYGISKPNRIENHLVFTKHGDYDGRTIIVNAQGKILNIIGGENFYDSETKLLFSIYDSDLSGFAVFDLKSDATLLQIPEIEDRPISFHKDFGERYFILCSNDEKNENNISIWEIEFELEGIMQVDLDTNQINESNILKNWVLEDVNCECAMR